MHTETETPTLHAPLILDGTETGVDVASAVELSPDT